MNGLQRARQSTQCRLKAQLPRKKHCLWFTRRVGSSLRPLWTAYGPGSATGLLRSLKTHRRNRHDASRLWPTGQREVQPVLGGALNHLISSVTFKITICIQKCYVMLQINCSDVRERLRSEFCCLISFGATGTSLQWPLFAGCREARILLLLQLFCF